jgi:plasmid stabilization system protein ParE
VTRSYVLTLSAAADLRDITRYTRKQWGDDQTRTYIAKLEQSAETLAKGGSFYKDLSFLHPGLRMVLCAHHYVFCLPRDAAPALVIAILHERMDLMVRVKLRLALD